MTYAVFPSGPFQTNAYILYCPTTLRAVCIDPAPGSFKALHRFIEKEHLVPQAIWLTHSHWDHIADASLVQEKYHIPLSVHKEDALNVESPGSDQLPCWVTIPPVHVSHYFTEGEILELGTLKVEVICTPGHTPGGVCFYLPDAQLLFSGDTLFQGTIGNLSFPTARPTLMWPSLAKLAALPREIEYYRVMVRKQPLVKNPG